MSAALAPPSDENSVSFSSSLNIAGHAVIGGAMSVAQGGEFGSGFIAAGLGSLAGPFIPDDNILLGTIASAVVGGLGAEISGGKFENGAITAAYGYLLNQQGRRSGARPGSMWRDLQETLNPNLRGGLDYGPRSPLSREQSLAPLFPPNNGFSGIPQPTHIMPGEIVSRYGTPSGRYLAPESVPFEMRGLPTGSRYDTYHVYEVLKPIPVLSGNIAPANGFPGGGTQYVLPVPVRTLLDRGFLKERGQ